MARGAAVHWEAVTAALETYVSGPDDPLGQSIACLRADWRRLEPSYPGSLVFSSVPAGESRSANIDVVTDVALAFEWLYADSGNADARSLSGLGAHEVDDRYRAAVVLVANAALVTINTLSLVRALWDRVELDLPDAPFTRRVTVANDVELGRCEHRRSSPPFGAEVEASLDIKSATGRWLPISESLPGLMSLRAEDDLR
jgi:hypothetical protein